MEQLKAMKQQLMACVQNQMGNLQNVDAKELGEAIDMIKDLEEAIYYKTITEAMEEKEKNGKEHHYYTERIIEPRYYGDGSERYMMDYDEKRYMPNRRYHDDFYMRDIDKGYGKMYYNGGSGSSNGGSSGGSGGSSGGSSSGGSRNYTEMMYPYPLEMRDSREGKSPMKRKSYMESKEMHKDKASQMKELENYVSELSKDLVEMIEGASPEEQQYLERKISQLATKIGHVSHV